MGSDEDKLLKKLKNSEIIVRIRLQSGHFDDEMVFLFFITPLNLEPVIRLVYYRRLSLYY